MVLVEHGLLEPPDLSMIINNHDQLQPTPQQLEVAMERSQDYWYHLTAMAVTRHCKGIPPILTSLRGTLNCLPTISTRQGKTMILHLDSSPSETLCIQASSTWHITGTAKCGVVGKKRDIPRLLHIGSRTLIPCEFGGKSFHQWPSISGEGNRAPSYLGILALGWSYILSARLLKLQVKNCEMAYTDLKHTRIQQSKSHGSSSVTIDIGKVDEDVARWWSALLAPGQGWKAIISQQMDQEWELKEPVFKDVAASSPPSFNKAFEFLVQFSQQHNLDSQLPVALATALTFPAHNYHGTAIQLPLPLPLPANNHAQQGVDSANSTALGWPTVDKELSYYMTLSCSLETLTSTLCGMFWEPTVTCNMVSPWLHPILQEIPECPRFSSTPGALLRNPRSHMQLSSTTIFTLWLGAVTSGSDPNYSLSNEVQRADVWRLLYLPPVVDDGLYYNSPLFTPWAPFGSTTAGQCVLRVAAHLRCPRHHLDQEASQEASLDLFQWVMINSEGTPPEKIYRDEWLQLEDESDKETGMSDDKNSASHASDEHLKGLEEWLDQPTAPSPVPSFDKGACMETGAG
ncbi:uncharacterized protein BDCG_09265 [Blastomyces dermatitidis ER-3]|uniref:Uncharacterized protein n=1 Tax=Ajellomyces dermatitidis (strain ER-3 / ATCC MYA-2586) TaxID=559297 RepID=A0ABP2EQU5_AJEDR|nr:uncharacterized protein BDCG_09265 [Blastomyces dermatitidis ER-3]EEQ85996.2 hypothetical protein BDCG_09265 [Blastomyces dermatitidis ER-3]